MHLFTVKIKYHQHTIDEMNEGFAANKCLYTLYVSMKKFLFDAPKSISEVKISLPGPE